MSFTIVLTGADVSTLKRIKRLISSLLADDISVTFTDNILDCCKLDDDSFVISISRLGMIYLSNENNCQVDVFSAADIVHYDDFKKLNSIEGKVDCRLVKAFRHVFGYHTIVFFAGYPAVTWWTEMSTGGVTVYDKKHAGLSAVNVKCLSPFHILLISGEEDDRFFYYYCSIPEFVNIFEWLYKYREIAQCDLTHDIYINKCLNYLKDFQASGFSGWVHTVHSRWEAQLHLYAENIDGFDMIDNQDDLLTRKKYVLDQNHGIRRTMTGDIEISNECFMGYICESIVVEILMGKCRNVWTLYFSSFEHLPFKYISHQTRFEFMKHEDTFPNQFVEDLFGDGDYPVMDLLKDMTGGTRLVKINEGYQKFVSNYRSTYFNTDLFGHRIVREVPSNADRKIWLMGSCVFSGYVEEDAYTVASCLQRKINAEFSGQYEVVDVSCDSGNISYNYNKILEKRVGSEDIVVILCDYFHAEHRAIEMDMIKIDEHFKGKNYSWDRPEHSSRGLLQITADKIFNNIKEDIQRHLYKYHFHVEKDLEIKIGQFLEDCQEQLQQNKTYQKICAGNTQKSLISKNGAIVMNCNPFTYGHQYLIETASRLVNLLYVFVVEEDKSDFVFSDRFRMVQEAAKEFSNVFVLPSGQFMISTVTFPGYFMKENPDQECYDTFLDLKIFTHYIAPALKINMRFVGEEPFDKVTAQYNHDMKILLSEGGIDVIEIPRLRREEKVISATEVRKLLKNKDYEKLNQYVPDTTLNILGL